MKFTDIIKRAERGRGITNATLVGTEHWNSFVSFLNWFGNPDPNSPINELAEQAGVTPNELKDHMANEARRLMFVRSVK
jgi:hypothetical protein